MLEIMLVNTAFAAGLAFVVLMICRFIRPGPATKHALWLVVIVKLLSPVGLMWALPLPFAKPAFLSQAPKPPLQASVLNEQRETNSIRKETICFSTVMIDSTQSTKEVGRGLFVVNTLDPFEKAKIEEASLADVAVGQSPPVEPTVSTSTAGSLYAWLLIVWLAGALVLTGRYLRSTLRFARYACSGKQASASLQRQVEAQAALLGVRAPRVRVLERLASPVIWSLFQPQLLWPKGLQDQLGAGGRRAVLIHELAHLRRRDHWVRWLELLAAIVHWWNPLFWLVRRQMRFHAELACDAWVTGMMPDARRAYAEALLEVCARSRRAAAPSPAVGVGGDGRRDFQRRLTMIMREQAPYRLASGAKLFVVLLLMAALPAWTLGQGKPEAKPQPTPEVKDVVLDVEKTLGVAFADFDNDGTLDLVVANAKAKDLETKIAELTKQLEMLKKMVGAKTNGKLFLFGEEKPGKVRIVTLTQDGVKVVEDKSTETKGDVKPTASGQPLRFEVRSDTKSATSQYKVIGPDGKEIKDAKVIVINQGKELTPKHVLAEVQVRDEKQLANQVEVRARQALAAYSKAEGVINLTRATYKLPKDKLESLVAFLKTNVKSSVLEIKLEGESLTVTTTPDAQATIRGMVHLMSQERTDREIKARWKLADPLGER